MYTLNLLYNFYNMDILILKSYQEELFFKYHCTCMSGGWVLLNCHTFFVNTVVPVKELLTLHILSLFCSNSG